MRVAQLLPLLATLPPADPGKAPSPHLGEEGANVFYVLDVYILAAGFWLWSAYIGLVVGFLLRPRLRVRELPFRLSAVASTVALG